MRTKTSSALAIAIPLLVVFHAPGMAEPTIPTPPTPPIPTFSEPSIPIPSFPSDYSGYWTDTWLPSGVIPTDIPTESLIPTFPVITFTITTAGSIVTATANVDIRLSSTVTQCEPFLIYYDLPFQSDSYDLFFQTPDGQNFLSIRFPSGRGYMDWICDIPAGYSFYVTGPISEYYTVQAGSFSACLRNVTATYTYAQYNTNVFQSYTVHPPSTTPPPSSFHASPIIPFPAASLSTITVNPDMPFVSPTATGTPSSPFTSSVSSSSSLPLNAAHKSSKFAIVGGVVGVLVIFLCTLVALTLLQRRKRKDNEKKKATVHPAFLKRTKHTGSGSGSHLPMVEAQKPSIPGAHSPLAMSISDLGPEVSFAGSPVIELKRNRSLTSVAPLPRPPNDNPAISTNIFLARQANDTETPSGLSSVMDIISRLCPSAREREMLIRSLHNSINLPLGSSATRMEGLGGPPIAGSSSNPPNLHMILESFTRLDDTERVTILTALGNMVAPQSRTLGPSARDSCSTLEPPPPPYGGYTTTRPDSIEEASHNSSVDITIRKGSENDMS